MQLTRIRRTLAVVLAFLLAAAMGVQGSTQAIAAPGDFQDTVDLNLIVTGATGTSSNSIAVLPGLTPVSLTTKIVGGTGADQAAVPGTYTLRAGNASATVDSRTGGPVTLALSPDSVRDGYITVSLSAQMIRADGCPETTDAVAAVNQATLTYTGTPAAPTSLADFFSPAMKSVSLLADPAAVPFATPAILQAAAALAVEYPKVAVTTDPPAKPDPFTRIVRFVPANGPAVTKIESGTAVPTLTITGDPIALTAAATTFGNEFLALTAGSPTTQGLNQKGQPADELSLRWRDVGSASPRLSGLGTVTASLSLSQAQFGGPISSLQINVQGTHIPTPQGATATASLLVNGDLYSSTLLGTNDTFALSANVGPDRIKRSSQIAVEVSSVPAGGSCRSASIPTRVDIDATASTIVATPGQSLQPGFDRFPQVLERKLPVAFAKGPNPQDLGHAVDIVASLSRLDSFPAAITVPSLNEFLKSDQPGLLVAAGPDESTELGAPLNFDPNRAPDTSPPTFSAVVAGPFAALEAFQSSGRDVLMLGAYAGGLNARAEALQNQLATQVAVPPDGWSNLTGNLFVTSGGVKPTSLDANGPEPADNSSAGTGAIPGWWWLVTALVIVAVVAVGFWFVRRRGPHSATGDSKSGAASG